MTKLPMFTYFLHVIKMTFVAYKTNKEISEYCTDFSTDISVQFNKKTKTFVDQQAVYLG